jgi:hypothetical protein
MGGPPPAAGGVLQVQALITPAVVQVCVPVVAPQEQNAVCPAAQVRGAVPLPFDAVGEHARPKKAAKASCKTCLNDAPRPREAPDMDMTHTSGSALTYRAADVLYRLLHSPKMCCREKKLSGQQSADRPMAEKVSF